MLSRKLPPMMEVEVRDPPRRQSGRESRLLGKLIHLFVSAVSLFKRNKIVSSTKLDSIKLYWGRGGGGI